MKRQFFLFALLLSFLSFSANLSAQYIVDAHSSRVKRFAENAAKNLMTQYNPNTGSDSYAIVDRWYYYEDIDTYEIHLQTYWMGASTFWGDKKTCNIDGILKVKRDGTNANFTTTYKNQQIKDIESNNNWLVGSIIALGIISAASSN